MKIFKSKKQILISLLIAIFLITLIVILNILLSDEKEVSIIERDFNKEDVIENYDTFKEKVNLELHRQGNPKQIYMAENPDLPFSKIETYTSSISLDKSLENVKKIDDIIVDYFSENDYSILYTEQEISITRKNDDTEIITLYFTDKTGSTSYPDYGNATFSKCENISLIIFKPNENLYCSAVGRNISSEELLEVVQSLNA